MRLADKIATMARRGAPLPYDAEVEWIESDGGLRVDTGLTRREAPFFEIRLMPTKGTSDIKYFGSYPGGCSVGTINGFWRINTTNTGWSQSSKEASPNAFSTISRTPNGWYIDGEKEFEISGQSYDYNYFLFAWNNSNSVLNTSQAIAYVKLYDNNNDLIRHLIPVRKDGVGFWFDTVSNTIFPATGTGAFVIGPDKAANAFSAGGGGY